MSKHCQYHQIAQKVAESRCKHKSKHKPHDHQSRNQKSMSESDYYNQNSHSHKSLIGKISSAKKMTRICDLNPKDDDYYNYGNMRNQKKQQQIRQLQNEVQHLNKRLTKCQAVLMKSHFEYQILRETVQKMKIQNIERGVYDYQRKRQHKQRMKQKEHQLLEQKYSELINLDKFEANLPANKYKKLQIKTQNHQSLKVQKRNFNDPNRSDEDLASNVQTEYYQTQLHDRHNKANNQVLKHEQQQNQPYLNSIKKHSEKKQIINVRRDCKSKQVNLKRKQFLKQENDISPSLSILKQNKQSKQTTAHVQSMRNTNHIKSQEIISNWTTTKKKLQENTNLQRKGTDQDQYKISGGSSNLSSKNMSKISQGRGYSNRSKLISSKQSSSKLKNQTPYKLLKMQSQQKQAQADHFDQYFDLQTFKQIDQTLNDNQKDSNLLQSVQFIRTNKNIKVFQQYPSFKKESSSPVSHQNNSSHTSQVSQISKVQNQYLQLIKVVQSLYEKLSCCRDPEQMQKLRQKIVKVEEIIESIKKKHNF